MQIIDDEVRLTADQEALLVLACGGEVLPLANVEAFAHWLATPMSEDLPAIRHGARMVLAKSFAAAFACDVQTAPGGARVWWVTRHPGTLAWLHAKGMRAHRVVDHLVLEDVASGDTVVGVLPLALVADCSERGVRCLHVSVPLGAADRGRELDAAAMRARGARLEEFVVHRRAGACSIS